MPTNSCGAQPGEKTLFAFHPQRAKIMPPHVHNHPFVQQERPRRLSLP